MNVKISAQNQRILESAINGGYFKDQEEALSEAIRLLGEKTEDHNGAALSADDWKTRFKQHLADTPSTAAAFVDDSRESIYEGRGE